MHPVIFHWARAVLSPEFLSAVPPDINCTALLNEVTQGLNVAVDLLVDANCPALQGEWDDILQAQVKLVELLARWDNSKTEHSKSCTIDDVTSFHYCKSNKTTPSINSTEETENAPLNSVTPLNEKIKTTLINDLEKQCSVVSDVPDDATLTENIHSLYVISNDCNNIDIIPALSKSVSSVNENTTILNDVQQVKVDNSQVILVTDSLVDQDLQDDTQNAKKEGELFMNIVLTRREAQPNNVSENTPIEKSDSIKVETGENPLDKLCQLLRIDDEDEHSVSETTSKTPDMFERKRRYEDNMPYRYFCSLCSYKTKRENQHIKHVRLHEKNNVTYICSQCQFTTIRIGTLRRHELEHAEGHLVNCSKCPYKTNNMKFLRRHMQTKHSPNTPALHCSQCDFKSFSVRELKKHKYVHKSDTPKVMYKCDLCPYKTHNKGHLRRHINNIHESIRPYLCHHCGKSFKRHDTLKQHKIIHGETGRTFACSTCNKLCRSSTHLKEHMTVHTTQRPFLCELCGATFKTRSNQSKHIQMMHSSVKLLPCPHCKRTFNTKASMIRHQMTHNVKESNADSKCEDSLKSFIGNSIEPTGVINENIVVPPQN